MVDNNRLTDLEKYIIGLIEEYIGLANDDPDSPMRYDVDVQRYTQDLIKELKKRGD